MDKNSEKKTSHDEWWAKIKAVSEANQKVQEVHKEDGEPVKSVKASHGISKSALILSIIIFLLAVIPRLYFLFVLSDPENANLGWYGDVYHRWQIAYLSQQIGFHHGFLTLWDFKGMDYFWGLLYPLLTIFLFTITGSIDIVSIRIMTILSSSLVIVFLFLLVKRYFNTSAALATALFMSFMPVVLFSDTTGEQEPVGLALIFGGMLLWKKKPLWTGILFALASMVRAEYWMITFGLVVVAIICDKNTNRRLLIAAGWFVPIFLYMKYLLDKTGNPIYPVYYNFFASIAGEWFVKIQLSPQVLLIKQLSQAIFIAFFLTGLFVFWKKPKYYLLFLFGIANILFISYTLGFGEYLEGYIVRLWVDRLFIWPYSFLGMLAAILLLYVLPKYLKLAGSIFGWVVFLCIIALTQLVWTPIKAGQQPALAGWPTEKELAVEISHYYHGGGILLPEDHPALTYALVRYEGVEGKNMVGQMFDPYFYMQGDPYANWSKNRKIVLKWLKQENIKFIVVYSSNERYSKLFQKEPQLFTLVGKSVGSGYNFYSVNQ